MKTIHYPNTIRSHLVTIVPKSTSKLRSALHVRYSIVITRFISRTNTAQSKKNNIITTVFLTLLTTTTMFIETI